jgi:hypothetical protein
MTSTLLNAAVDLLLEPAAAIHLCEGVVVGEMAKESLPPRVLGDVPDLDHAEARGPFAVMDHAGQNDRHDVVARGARKPGFDR